MSTTQYTTTVADIIAGNPFPLTADTIREIAREPREALILPRLGPWGASAVAAGIRRCVLFPVHKESASPHNTARSNGISGDMI